ncbi:putative Acetylornithine deacetylase/succinyl-diaminopimelate desuccinylase [Vibrio nigripulchritudo SFn27]|uniref:Putative Acetylornithine deacetylase/succinyl-diaminopimelate desuccinylase n=1 Tax=Vibrio nigripulchritudo TaxID=28173 RepID=U4KA76_9VIBR|nr:acetylornithine deacetylase/succinyl-diaminopimelate desuccinylase family protein [Vibrio nigripulchritudo]CCN83810.1 putative Acetylornithine deacetylase/succinyl-diaminopimelate desuccinylase [Vibrio nigripulchritudo BLFn1]CCN87182.1 putative Acetylornithine deacetylase/succinyl-diaminopimelate desuccinylase [Vibrio nigripulchritudo SFn27]CCN94538.1 putative Acetylornithine deacetylase/succinyl-diaminopimelate desuccinylase [Vibrio nigripulchritudo ENn2]CCO40896.1 putative Acetylornithine 
MRQQDIKKLSELIDKKEGEIISLAQDLIAFPTVNPPGDAYKPCAEYIGNRLKNKGLNVEFVRSYGSPGDSEQFPRINLIARIEGSRPGPCVHFNSHIDVVEVGKGWTVDPFGGEIHDGKLYGRGACDMKGGLAASIIAVETIIESGIDFPGAIEISGTVDEESGGYGGAGYLAEKGYFSKPKVDHVIIPEPLHVDQVCIGHRGVWWAEVETHGHIAHGSMPFLGNCAVRHMGAFLHKVESELMPLLASKHTDMPVIPEGAKQSTLNINSIHGGQNEGYEGLPSPCVPDSCRLVLDRRYLIEEDPEQVREEIRQLLEQLKDERPGFDFDIKSLLSFEPTMTDLDAPVVRVVQEEIERVLGKPANTVVSPGTYDQKHIVRSGLLKGCIAYGPGLLHLAHQPDEYVVIEDMLKSAKVMAIATLRLLEGDDPSNVSNA